MTGWGSEEKAYEMETQDEDEWIEENMAQNISLMQKRKNYKGKSTKIIT